MFRIYIVLVLIVLILGFLVRGNLQKMLSEAIKPWPKKLAWFSGLLLLILLAATGKLNWFFALMSVVIASLVRLIPVITNLSPQLHRLWVLFNTSKNKQEQDSSRAASSSVMSREQALEVLGLKAGASDAEIIEAHRKLISRLHPDKGGSDYLAAQINLAKKVLMRG